MIHLDSVTKTFDGPGNNTVTAIRDVTLHVERGQWVTIVGSNGSGKTTLLNLIAGTNSPSSGRVSIDGQDVTNIPEWRRSRHIARVFQQPHMGAASGLTLAENLALSETKGSFSAFRWCVGRGDKKRYRDLVADLEMGLEDRLQNTVSTLSGGQRQALAVLMAMLEDPKVFLLDEHVAALDPAANQRVMETTEELIQSRELTTLMVTHNIEQALQYGERLLMLHRGQVVLDVDGPDKSALTSDEVVNLFHKRAADTPETPKFFLN